MGSIFHLPKGHFLCYLFFLGFLILHFSLGYIGHYGFDDMEYAKLAFGLSEGRFDVGNHFSYRLALLVPTAISYWLFGVNDIASSIPPLLAASLTLYFISLFLKHQKLSTLIIALSLCTLSPWFLRYSYMLMPDIYVCLSFIASIYFLWKREESGFKAASLGFSISLFFGLMAKGTIVLILPLLFIFFLIDLFNKKHLKFWITSIVLLLIIFSIYLFAVFLLSGDALMRFKVIGENSYLNRCSYAEQGTNILLQRISVDFLRMLQADFLLSYFLFLLPTLLYLSIKKRLKTELLSHFLIVTATLLLLSSNFMSISLKAYNPMCLDIRHYLYLIPIASLAMAVVISEQQLMQKLKWWLIAAIAIGFALALHFEHPDFLTWILPFSAVLIIYLLAQDQKWSKLLLIIALPVSMLAKPINMMNAAQESNYEGRRDFVMEHLISDGEAKLIWTDPVQANLGNYFFGFQKDKILFKDFRSKQSGQFLDSIPSYYLMNWHTAQQSFITPSQIPIALKQSAQTKAINEDKELAIAIYQISAELAAKSYDRLVIKEVNNFELELDPWTGTSDNLTSDPVNENNQTSRVGLYSSTLNLSLDSLLSNKTEYLIKVSCKIFVKQQTQAKLVVSIENQLEDGKQENLFYSSQEIDPLIGSYSNWWEIKLEDLFRLEKLGNNSRLKVYVWNIDQGELYFDDVKVEIYSP